MLSTSENSLIFLVVRCPFSQSHLKTEVLEFLSTMTMPVILHFMHQVGTGRFPSWVSRTASMISAIVGNL